MNERRTQVRNSPHAPLEQITPDLVADWLLTRASLADIIRIEECLSAKAVQLGIMIPGPKDDDPEPVGDDIPLELSDASIDELRSELKRRGYTIYFTVPNSRH